MTDLEQIKIAPSQIVSSSYVYHHFNKLKVQIKEKPAFVINGDQFDTVILSYEDFTALYNGEYLDQKKFLKRVGKDHDA